MLEWMQQMLNQFGQAIQSVLPLSPFQTFISNIHFSEGVAWLNWFIPVGEMVSLFVLWLGAYGTYLLYRIILRWVKAVA